MTSGCGKKKKKVPLIGSHERDLERTVSMLVKNKPYVVPGTVLVATREWHMIGPLKDRAAKPSHGASKERTLRPGEVVMVVATRRYRFKVESYFHIAGRSEAIDLLLLTEDDGPMVLTATNYDYSLNPSKDPDYTIFLGGIFDLLKDKKKIEE